MFNEQEHEETRKMTVSEAGRLGGKKTSETHDSKFYKKIGRKGGKTRAQNIRKNGMSPELRQKYSEAGRKGGKLVKKNKYRVIDIEDDKLRQM